MFRGVVPEQFVAELPESPEKVAALDRLLQEHRRQIAAVIVEPLVQGAGGMKLHSPETCAEIRRLCERHGLLLIFDEIFSGFGRTGTLFACEQAGVVPDILCLSKALTGGTLPLAATVATEKVYAAFLSDDAEAALMHGPTFMAYPLGCAAANASLDLFASEPRIAQAKAIEGQLREELTPCAGLPGVHEVRVKGAIGVVQMKKPVDAVALRAKFVKKGCWIKPFGDVVYLTPPLVITADDLSVLTRAICETLREPLD